jgi:CheY-like chemotaxis protein
MLDLADPSGDTPVMLNLHQSDVVSCEGRNVSPGSVLVVEDDGLLTLMLEDQLLGEGATEVVACRSAAEALAQMERRGFDCAILDIAMHGGSTYEVADVLASRRVPFMFCTGFRAEEIEERHRDRPLLSKPYGDGDFRAMLARTLARV